MIKFFTYFYLFLALVLFSSCSEEPEEELKPEITFKTTVIPDGSALLSSEGGEISISFTTNVDWTAQSSATWMTINPSSGKSGSSVVTLKTSSNTTTESRSATLTISAQGKSATMRVEQKGLTKSEVSLSTDLVEIGSDEGSQSVEVTSNMDWTVKSDESWCTVSPDKGSKNGNFNITVTANDATTDRRATVTVTSGSGDNTDTKTIAVTQKGKELATLTLSVSTFEIGDNGGSQPVEVTSNMDWTVTSDQSWCTISPDKGSKNGSFTITLQANTTASDRKATVTITAGSGDNTATKTIAVTQKAPVTGGNEGLEEDDEIINL